MEIQLPIFKHFKYSGEKKKKLKEQNGDNQFINTKKEKITCQWIFYSSRDSTPAFVVVRSCGKVSPITYLVHKLHK